MYWKFSKDGKWRLCLLIYDMETDSLWLSREGLPSKRSLNEYDENKDNVSHDSHATKTCQNHGRDLIWLKFENQKVNRYIENKDKSKEKSLYWKYSAILLNIKHILRMIKNFKPYKQSSNRLMEQLIFEELQARNFKLHNIQTFPCSLYIFF